MVQVTAAIGQFFVLLLESMLYAGVTIAGSAVAGVAAASGVVIGVKRARRSRKG